jgi:hypothetical protein
MGGKVSGTTNFDSYKGNKLIVDGTVTGKFNTISNFAVYEFTVDSANTNTPILRAAKLDLKDPTDATQTLNAQLEPIVTTGSQLLGVGSTVPLIEADDLAVNGTFSQQLEGYQGTSIIYDYVVEYDPDSNSLAAKVVGVRINDGSASLAQLPLADLAFVNQGSDMISSYTVNAARSSLLGDSYYGVFGALGYNKFRYSTGSHIDVKGLTGQIGVSVGADSGTTSVVAALFFEFGKGAYDSYNSYPDIGRFHAFGKTSYAGGGILGRYDFGTEFTSRPYVDASFRAGRSYYDFKTDQFQFTRGAVTLFSFEGTYYGFHAGGGFIVDMDQMGTSLDLSAKYFYTEREAADVVVEGERITFGKNRSKRIRGGGRFNYAFSDQIKPYIGGYYEYEFAGQSGVKVRDFYFTGGSIKGATGIGELGVSLESLSTPIQFELGMQGAGGKRDGLGGTMKLTYEF